MRNIDRPRGQVRDGETTEDHDQAQRRARHRQPGAVPVTAPMAEPTADEVEEVEAVRQKRRHILAAEDSKNLLAHAKRSIVDPVNVPLGHPTTMNVAVAVAGDGADDPDTVRAVRAFRTHLATITTNMTMERAQAVRQARADGSTFARLAEDTHAAWGPHATWTPAWNRIAGRALVRAAAQTLGEDPLEEPWN